MAKPAPQDLFASYGRQVGPGRVRLDGTIAAEDEMKPKPYAYQDPPNVT